MDKSKIKNLKHPQNDTLLDRFKDLYYQSDKNAILTGSLALVLLGLIEERECYDIDIVIPYYIDFSSLGEIKRFNNPYSNPTFEIKLNKYGTLVHVIIDPDCQFRLYTVNVLNCKIKISNHEDIFVAKFKSFMFFKNKKHRKDIESFFAILDGKGIVDPEDNLPF